MFKGEEIADTISQQRLIHLHEKDWSDGMTLPHGYHPGSQARWRSSPVTFKHHINHTELAPQKRRKKEQENTLFTSSSSFLLLKLFTEASFAGLDLILFGF